MEIVNLTKDKHLARDARLADSFFLRLKGLLGTDYLLAGEGLVIRPCSSIHTFGMSYPIDVIFVDADNQVLKTVSCMGPWQMAACGGSRFVVELPAGMLVRTGTETGDQLRMES